jgi:energy-coupling factor transport system ATP-binding protein
VIHVECLSFSYANGERPVLDGVGFHVAPGELVLVVGPSGGGKSTLLRCLNGLVPHFHGGIFGGRVLIDGRDTRECQPRDMADVVGLVMQDPESQIVAETVEDEMSFGMEQLGLPATALRKRLEEALDALDLVSLRERRLNTLSGGELQRVAIASVLSMQPKVLLLDEPTSQLDPQAAEELLTTVQRLNDDLGLTVLLAEHRMERVVQYADRVLYVAGDGSVTPMDVRHAMATLDLAPAVARLGKTLGWSPVPLSVREGRAFLGSTPPALCQPNGARPLGEALVSVDKLTVEYDGVPALGGVSLRAHRGEVLAIMGRNGAGKTTLLRALVGLAPLTGGSGVIVGREVAQVKTEELVRDVAFVPQDPATVLYGATVEEEIADTLAGTKRVGSVADAFSDWRLEHLAQRHPGDLSAGERQRAALAAMLVGRPDVILLDEPTRGMDHETKRALIDVLKARCAEGAAVIIASHDVELAGACADRVLLLADGALVVDGPARDVLTDTLTFSTQVNKLMGGRFLTPEDVTAALAEGATA